MKASNPFSPHTGPLNVNPLLGICVTSFPEGKQPPHYLSDGENICYTRLKQKYGDWATLRRRRWRFPSTKRFTDKSRCWRSVWPAGYSSICSECRFCLWVENQQVDSHSAREDSSSRSSRRWTRCIWNEIRFITARSHFVISGYSCNYTNTRFIYHFAIESKLYVVYSWANRCQWSSVSQSARDREKNETV